MLGIDCFFCGSDVTVPGPVRRMFLHQSQIRFCCCCIPSVAQKSCHILVCFIFGS